MERVGWDASVCLSSLNHLIFYCPIHLSAVEAACIECIEPFIGGEQTQDNDDFYKTFRALSDELETLNKDAQKLEKAIAANVAGILEA